MSSDGRMRASDRDRERATEVLRDAHAVGRLTLEEFLDRAGAVGSARTWGELHELTADLPEQSRLFQHGPGTEFRQETGELHRSQRRPAAPLLVVAASWLGIVAVAHVIAAIPLAALAVFVLWMACRR
jgi:uncharacterized membrane protein